MKLDIGGGFYQIWLNLYDIPQLAIASGSTNRVDRAPPPDFCPTTETVTDVTDRHLANHWEPPPH
jgi:hypothetical protein